MAEVFADDIGARLEKIMHNPETKYFYINMLDEQYPILCLTVLGTLLKGATLPNTCRLEMAIEKFEFLRVFLDAKGYVPELGGVNTCALCWQYFGTKDYCRGCPIRHSGFGRQYCHRTPFDELNDTISTLARQGNQTPSQYERRTMWNRLTREVELLKKLLQKEQEREAIAVNKDNEYAEDAEIMQFIDWLREASKDSGLNLSWLANDDTVLFHLLRHYERTYNLCAMMRYKDWALAHMTISEIIPEQNRKDELGHMLATIGHDLRGFLENERKFEPRTAGY